MMKRTQLIIAALVLMFGMAACDNEENAYPSALVTKTDFWINDREAEAFQQLLREIRSADERLDVAVYRLPESNLANAIVAAHQAGVEVRVVADADFQTDEGFGILEAAGVEVRYSNGQLRYLPDPTLSPILDNCGFNSTQTRVTCPAADPFMPLSAGEMVRPGSYNVMSHNFALIDDRVAWNFSSHPGVTTVPFAFRIDSETAWESFWREFNQLWVGVDSTNLDIYNGPNKSTGQWQPLYITEHGEMMMRFSPQDRIVKSVIDDVYKARDSVWIMSDTISEEFLIDALEYKIDAGFDVQIVVNDAVQEPELRGRLDDLGARFIDNVNYVPSFIVIDGEAEGEEFRRAHVASHPMWRTGAFRVVISEPDDEVEIFQSDYFTDGMMWTMTAYPDQENPILDEMIATFRDYYTNAQ